MTSMHVHVYRGDCTLDTCSQSIKKGRVAGGTRQTNCMVRTILYMYMYVHYSNSQHTTEWSDLKARGSIQRGIGALLCIHVQWNPSIMDTLGNM